MNKGVKRIAAAFFASLFLVIFITPSAFAENGDGTGGGSGNGTGGKSDIALTVVSSSIKNNEKNVPLNPTIDLQFNKNVVNLTVKSDNSKCFHLVDSKGNGVTIKIIFPDDQLRKEYREHIFIVPSQNLAPDSKYTLYIDKTLQAKNAKSLDNTNMIAFTTGTKVIAVPNPSLKKLADDVEVFTNKLPLTANSYVKKSSASPAANKTTAQPINNNNLSIIIIVTIIAIIAIFFVILLFAKMKSSHKHSDHS